MEPTSHHDLSDATDTPSELYSRGYIDGLEDAKAGKVMPSGLEVLALGNALSDLGQHAARMSSDDEIIHENCVACLTMVALSRVVDFGDQIRAARKSGRTN